MIGVLYLGCTGIYEFYCPKCTRKHIHFFRYPNENCRVWTISDRFAYLNLPCRICNSIPPEPLYIDEHNKLFPEGLPENRIPGYEDV